MHWRGTTGECSGMLRLGQRCGRAVAAARLEPRVAPFAPLVRCAPAVLGSRHFAQLAPPAPPVQSIETVRAPVHVGPKLDLSAAPTARTHVTAPIAAKQAAIFELSLSFVGKPLSLWRQAFRGKADLSEI